MKPHKHAEVIKAWADGADIQWREVGAELWADIEPKSFSEYYEYRAAPKKPKKISVGGRMVNPPMTELPEIGSVYWLAGTYEIASFANKADHADNGIFKSLNMFESKQAASEWSDAWIELKKQALAGKAIGIIEQQSDDGWIDWRGGECPVSEGTVVAVVYKNNHITSRPRSAGKFHWAIEGDSYDIIKYKVVSEN